MLSILIGLFNLQYDSQSGLFFIFLANVLALPTFFASEIIYSFSNAQAFKGDTVFAFLGGVVITLLIDLLIFLFIKLKGKKQ